MSVRFDISWLNFSCIKANNALLLELINALPSIATEYKRERRNVIYRHNLHYDIFINWNISALHVEPN